MFSILWYTFILLCSCMSTVAFQGGATSYCLQPNDAQQIAINWQQLASNYSDNLADNVLAPDYTQFSSSLQAILQSCTQESVLHPSLAPFFTSRRQFKASQASQAPLDYQKLDMWHSCDTVILRFQFPMQGVTGAPEAVAGMATIRTTPAPAGSTQAHWIKTVYDEWDLRRYCKLFGMPLSDLNHP